MKTRTCLECGEPLQGRIDRKFCCDACRVSYNNRIYRKENLFIHKINKQLKHNRNILKSLNPSGKAKVSKEELLKKGFSFNFFTHQLKTSRGQTYFFVYEYGYLPLENDMFFLVKNTKIAEEELASK
ncbi:MAG: hypothetical protein N2Z72_02505 [Bacteroidales bacterium]|nr:hypothetical protein [Bacteroidales bacterium]